MILKHSAPCKQLMSKKSKMCYKCTTCTTSAHSATYIICIYHPKRVPLTSNKHPIHMSNAQDSAHKYPRKNHKVMVHKLLLNAKQTISITRCICGTKQQLYTSNQWHLNWPNTSANDSLFATQIGIQQPYISKQPNI